MNFTPSFITEPSPGAFDPITSNWSGVIGRLVKNEADLGFDAFTITSRRLDAVDFTLPLVIGKTRLYFKKMDLVHVKWGAYLEVCITLV